MGRGRPLLWNDLGQELPAPDVEHEGHPGLGQAGPDRFQVDVGGREVPRGVGGEPDGRHAGLQRLLEGPQSPPGIVERQVAHRLEPLVRGTKCAHGPVQGPGPAVEHVGVLAPGEMGQREGREDELGLDLEGIEHPGAHLGVEGPGGHPALGALQHLGPDVLVAVGLPELGQACHQLGRPGPRSLQAERAEPVPQLRIGESAQPLGRLHEVAVGVEDPGVHGPPNGSVVDPRIDPPGRHSNARWPGPANRLRHPNLQPDAEFLRRRGRTDNIYPGHNFL